MFIYLMMIGLVAFAGFLYIQFPNVISKKDNTALIGPDAKKCYMHPMFILILFVLLFPYVARYKVGTDFTGYLWFFENDQLLSFKELLKQRDYGYFILERITTRLSNGNWYFHMAVVGFIIYFPVLYYYARFSHNFLYSILIYIFFMQYFSGYNGIRQAIAASILVMALISIFERKYIRAGLFVFIAVTFHSTVILILPLMLLSFIDYRNKIFNIFKALLLMSALTLKNIWSVIIDFLSRIGQEKLVDDYNDLDLSGTSGASFFRVAIYLIIVILCVIYSKRSKDFVSYTYGDNSPMVINLNFVMNAVQLALVFVAAGQNHWLFVRFTTYFALYIPVMLSFVYPVIKKSYRSLFCIISVALFFMYMYMLLPSQSNLLPYQTEWGWYFK